MTLLSYGILLPLQPKTWLVVGFMPMMENTANYPKVRYKMGEGGAPPDMVIRMTALYKAYERVGTALTMGIGLNGAIFVIELPKVSLLPSLSTMRKI